MTICIHGTVVVGFLDVVIHVIGIRGIGRQTQTLQSVAGATIVITGVYLAT